MTTEINISSNDKLRGAIIAGAVRVADHRAAARGAYVWQSTGRITVSADNPLAGTVRFTCEEPDGRTGSMLVGFRQHRIDPALLFFTLPGGLFSHSINIEDLITPAA